MAEENGKWDTLHVDKCQEKDVSAHASDELRDLVLQFFAYMYMRTFKIEFGAPKFRGTISLFNRVIYRLFVIFLCPITGINNLLGSQSFRERERDQSKERDIGEERERLREKERERERERERESDVCIFCKKGEIYI